MISLETVTATWQRIARMSLDEAADLTAQMNEEQPVALYYLLSLRDLPFTGAEHELVHYVGLVVWQMVAQSARQLYQVTEESLEQARGANMQLLDRLASSGCRDFIAVGQRLARRHAEPEVLRYIIEALVEAESEDNPGEPALRPDAQGLAFMQVKVLLDAMLASLGPRPPLVA